MGNEYQQEDLYDFRFDVAADQSVDRDSDCPEFDFPGGGGGELGAVEELASLAEEEEAAAASAQQPGRGSPPVSMSKITSAGGIEAASSPMAAEVSKHMILGSAREDQSSVQSASYHQVLQAVKGMNSTWKADEAAATLKKISTRAAAGGEYETHVLKALNGKLQEAAVLDLDLKKNQINGSQFGWTELLHEKPGSTPPNNNRTPPRRALSVGNSSCVSPKVVPPAASSTAEAHVKQLKAIKVHSKQLESGAADSLAAAGNDRKPNSGCNSGTQLITAPALSPTRSFFPSSSQRRRSLAASYPGVSDSIQALPSSSSPPPPEHPPRKFFTVEVLDHHHHSMSISKSPRYVAPTIAASLKIVTAKQSIPSAGISKSSLPNKSMRRFNTHVGADTLLGISTTQENFKPASVRPRSIKQLEEQQAQSITAAARRMSKPLGSKPQESPQLEAAAASATTKLQAYPLSKGKSGQQSSIGTEATSFKFRCEERAERRRDFYDKLEDRVRAKAKAEAKAVAEAKEAKEAQLKLLRRSLTYKANPVPSFYQEPPPPPTELKRIPLTRPKSPKFTPSRRRSTGQTSLAADPRDDQQLQQQAGTGQKAQLAISIQRCSLDGSTLPIVKRLPLNSGLALSCKQESVLNQGSSGSCCSTRNRSITTTSSQLVQKRQTVSANSSTATAKMNKEQHSADTMQSSSNIEEFRNPRRIATARRRRDSVSGKEISSGEERICRRFANSDQDPATTQNTKTSMEIREQSTVVEEDSVDEHGTDALEQCADDVELQDDGKSSLSPESASADHDHHRRKLWSAEELAKIHSGSRRGGGGGGASSSSSSSPANMNGTAAAAAAAASYASVKDIVMEFSRRLGTTPPASISHQN
ncbi:unnamed protein product [Sphagnum jensenii]|uniref:TPX2 C-terminal domain-containing protein n=1 Tax=Sphagnum jensenii TaxID=128206 RepID=A0ABP1BXR4_9BRYO